MLCCSCLRYVVQHISNNVSKKHTASTIRNILQSPATQPEMFLVPVHIWAQPTPRFSTGPTEHYI